MRALKSPQGFTIAELMVVVAIIVILMSLLFPAVQGALEAAKKAQAKNDVTQIATAIVAYDTEYGRLPSANPEPQQLTGDILNALVASNDTLNPRKIIFRGAQLQEGQGRNFRPAFSLILGRSSTALASIATTTIRVASQRRRLEM
jgi:prepilin-type N-terminal cleavage/methylation domain-containing protein